MKRISALLAALLLAVLLPLTTLPAMAADSTASDPESSYSAWLEENDYPTPSPTLSPEELDALRFPDADEARSVMAVVSVVVIAAVAGGSVLYRTHKKS